MNYSPHSDTAQTGRSPHFVADGYGIASLDSTVALLNSAGLVDEVICDGSCDGVASCCTAQLSDAIAMPEAA